MIKMIEIILIVNSIFCILVFVWLMVSRWDREFYETKIDALESMLNLKSWTLENEIKMQKLQQENTALYNKVIQLRAKMYEYNVPEKDDEFIR